MFAVTDRNHFIDCSTRCLSLCVIFKDSVALSLLVMSDVRYFAVEDRLCGCELHCFIAVVFAVIEFVAKGVVAAVFFPVHFSLLLFTPISIYILLISTCTIV